MGFVGLAICSEIKVVCLKHRRQQRNQKASNILAYKVLPWGIPNGQPQTCLYRARTLAHKSVLISSLLQMNTQVMPFLAFDLKRLLSTTHFDLCMLIIKTPRKRSGDELLQQTKSGLAGVQYSIDKTFSNTIPYRLYEGISLGRKGISNKNVKLAFLFSISLINIWTV